MEKHMESDMVAQDWDRVLLDVAQDDNTIIIEQDGEPIAILLPAHAYKHLHRVHETGILDRPTDRDRRRTEIRDEAAD